MTLTQMQYFSTICECQNISVAAKMLFISQPALSATLAGMEEEVGFKLFERKSKGVYPTEEGLMLLEHVNSVLRRMNLLTREIPMIAKNQDIIKVGFRPYAGESIFFQVYREFIRDRSDIILKVNEMSNTNPYIYLEEKVFDFLVASKRVMPDQWESKYECCLLGQERIQLFCHKDSAPARKGFVDFMEFATYPIVIWEGHQVMINTVNTVLEKRGLQMNIIAVLPQLTGVLHYVYSNLAMGFLSGDFLSEINTIQEVRIKDPSLPLVSAGTVPVYAFWKKDIEKYRSKKLFIDFLRGRSPGNDIT